MYPFRGLMLIDRHSLSFPRSLSPRRRGAGIPFPLKFGLAIINARDSSHAVIPAQANPISPGPVQAGQKLDSRLRGNDRVAGLAGILCR